MNVSTDRIGAGITLGALVVLFLHLTNPHLKLDAVGLSLIVLAMLPWLLPLLGQYLASGKILGQEFTFLQGKVQEQGIELQNQKEVIALIHQALTRNLTIYEHRHLMELESAAPCRCVYSDFLRDEMIRLCQHGYALETFHASLTAMAQRGGEPFELKDFFRISDDGRAYLELLRRLQGYIGAAGSDPASDER